MNRVHWPFKLGYFASSCALGPSPVTSSASGNATEGARIELRLYMLTLFAKQTDRTFLVATRQPSVLDKKELLGAANWRQAINYLWQFITCTRCECSLRRAVRPGRGLAQAGLFPA